MEKSDSIKEISKALVEFQSMVPSVKKDGLNPFFKSKYATFENVVETIAAPLMKNGLSYSQLPDGDGLYTIIMHTSGEWIGAHAALELKSHTPQDQGSAITYMRRYALSAALGLATEEDDDGNAATQAAKAKPEGGRGFASMTDDEKRRLASKSIERPKVVADPINAKKRLIKELCDEIALAPLLSAEDYKSYVMENCKMPLEEENYGAIIECLEGLKFINTIE